MSLQQDFLRKIAWAGTAFGWLLATSMVPACAADPQQQQQSQQVRGRAAAQQPIYRVPAPYATGGGRTNTLLPPESPRDGDEALGLEMTERRVRDPYEPPPANEPLDPPDLIPATEVAPVVLCADGSPAREDGTCAAAVACPEGQTLRPDGTCLAEVTCPKGFVANEQGVCILPSACAPGATMSADGRCIAETLCPGGATPHADGSCPGTLVCSDGSSPDDAGNCRGDLVCPAGSSLNAEGRCQMDALCADLSAGDDCLLELVCADSSAPDANGTCPAEVFCQDGTAAGPGGVCRAQAVCPGGAEADANGNCLGVTFCSDGMPPVAGSCERETTCSDGRPTNIDGTCSRNVLCADGSAPDKDFACTGTETIELVCPRGSPDGAGGCTEYGAQVCPDGRDPVKGACEDDGEVRCSDPRFTLAEGVCTRTLPPTCPPSTVLDPGTDQCVLRVASSCPAGTVRRGERCVTVFTCPQGTLQADGTCQLPASCPDGSPLRSGRCGGFAPKQAVSKIYTTYEFRSRLDPVSRSDSGLYRNHALSFTDADGDGISEFIAFDVPIGSYSRVVIPRYRMKPGATRDASWSMEHNFAVSDWMLLKFDHWGGDKVGMLRERVGAEARINLGRFNGFEEVARPVESYVMGHLVHDGKIWGVHSEGMGRGNRYKGSTLDFGDVDGDGDLEFVGFEHYPSPGRVLVGDPNDVPAAPGFGIWAPTARGWGSGVFSSMTNWFRQSCEVGGHRSGATSFRAVGDVTGDGKADVLGIFDDTVYVAKSTGASFESPAVWLTHTDSFGRGGCLDVVHHPIRLGDVSGDGKDDIVFFTEAGVSVAISTGTGFLPLMLWLKDYGGNQGWDGADFRDVGDVDGDGKADIVGLRLEPSTSDDPVVSTLKAGHGTLSSAERNRLATEGAYVFGGQRDLVTPTPTWSRYQFYISYSFGSY